MNLLSLGTGGRSLARLLLVGLLLYPALGQADDWTYTLRPGDELWSVAKQFCGSARLADKIAEHNNIATPALVRAGMRIRIPTAWLAFAPAGAVLTELSGQVDYLPDSATTTQPQPATLAQIVPMGSILITAEGSALVQFADGSTLAIQPRSRVLFNKLTAFGPAGMVDTHLRFSYGNGTTVVKPQNRGDRFRIETPEGIAAVRGTEFRVGYAPAEQLATTETLEGEVAFVANNQATALPSGYGIAASPAGLVKEALLPAPIIKAAESYTFDGQLEWQAVPGATAYTVAWARQASPNISVQVSQHAQAQANIELAPGAYVARVRAISEAGIAGEDGLEAIQVLSSAPRPEELVSPLVGTTTLAWTAPSTGQPTADYLVEVKSQLTLATETHRSSQSSLVLDLPPGHYQWRVRDDQSAWSDSTDFTVVPAAPFNLSTSRKKKTLTLTWQSVPEAQGYVVVVQQKNGRSYELETTQTQAKVVVESFGMHSVSVVATDQELHSSAATLDVMVTRRPWWLLALALLAFAL